MRFFKVLAVVSFVLVALLGWHPANALEADGRSLYDVIKERGVLIVGNKYDFPPGGYMNKQGKPVGIDVSFGKYIAEKMGVKWQSKQITSKTRIPMLLNGDIDMVLAVMNPTRERMKTIDFTQPYYMTGLSIMIRKGSGIKSLADLAAPKVVAGVQGSNDMKNFLRLQPKGTAIYFQEHPQAGLAVLKGKADATITTIETLEAFASKHPDELEVIYPPFLPDPWVMGLRPNDTKWRALLEQSIMDATMDGSLVKWAKEHTGQDITFKPFVFPDYYK